MNKYSDKYSEKITKLKNEISACVLEDVVVAFSGGVDSSLLLKMVCEEAKKCGSKVYGILLHTMLHLSRDVEESRKIAEEVGGEFLTIELDELEQAGIVDNPKDRCYLCKKYMFRALKEKAEELGVKNIFEGTNADDLQEYRPGIRAVRELDIRSPLAVAGFTKEDVRRLAEEYGISVSRKPSTPCLATRFPYGSRLTYEDMRTVERGEAFLRELGFYNVRLRVHDKLVRIEVDTKDMGLAEAKKEEIVTYLKSLGYMYVTLDLEGFRSGSMDV